MITALVSKTFTDKFGTELNGIAQQAGKSVKFMALPEQSGARLAQQDCDRIDCSFLDRDIRFSEQLYAAFNDAMVASKSVKWSHVSSSGAGQLPFVPAAYERGVTITTSTGSNAEPVAQTGLTGLLMLARGFSRHMRGQAAHEWRPLRTNLPDDLRGQTLLIIGLGAVGTVFAGYARAFGMKVIGVRRSPLKPDDPVDELYAPSKLSELLPRADWIVLTCPLTKETHNMLDATAFKLMRKGVRIINIARGELVDEAALIEAIRSGHVGGAAIDAFTQEPLPAGSPFWDLPNVVVSPHSGSSSTGNEQRVAEMFIANFGHWVRGEPMFNVVSSI